MSPRTRFGIDVVVLLTMLVTILSGLVLLASFHMGGQSWRPEALGLSRLAWQNLHRIGALAALAGVALHVAVSSRPLAARLRRALRRERAAGDGRELVLYLVFATTAVAGFVAWLVLDGAMPLLGPASLAHPSHQRHHWLDVHHLTGLAALYLGVGHVRRRWRGLVGLGRRAVARPPAGAARQPERDRLASAR